MVPSSKTLAITGIVGALAMISALGLFFWPFIFRPSLFRNKVLAENITIGPEWTEINFRDPIKVDTDTVFVGLYLDPPYLTPLGSKGIKTPDGQIVNPEITLIDVNGNEFALTRSGAGGEEISRYSYSDGLPRDRAYTRLLLRSDVPIKTRQILWSGYDIKDLK